MFEIQENPPKTRHSSTVQTLQYIQTKTDTHKGQDTNKSMLRKAKICTLGKQNRLSINEWQHKQDSQESLLAREDCWFDRVVKEAIKLEKPSLNRGGGLRHFLSAIWSTPASNPNLYTI